jgi:hypothetical protein
MRPQKDGILSHRTKIYLMIFMISFWSDVEEFTVEVGQK